jgi:hypothetical protein
MVIAITRKIVQWCFGNRVIYTVQFQSTRVIPADITKGESALYNIVEPPWNSQESMRGQTPLSLLY